MSPHAPAPSAEPRDDGSASGRRGRAARLWSALRHPPSSPALAAVVLALWLLVHSVILLRAAAPAVGLGGGPFPWRMFAHASPYENTFRADARARGGPWVSLPVERVFRYRRGATNLRIYDHAKQFFAAGHDRERARFAHHLAVELASWLPPGAVEIRLRFHRRHLDTGAEHDSELGRFAIAP